MTYKDAEIGLASIPLAGDHYAHWQHPLRGTRIYMHPTPMRTLSAQALQSFKARRPSEIGGILWGKPPAEAEDQSTVITCAEFVHSEGPFYNSTPADARNLIKALNTPRMGTGLSLVGYFRSHIRDGLCLTPQDQELIEQHMRDPDSIFLIIRPFDMGICMAGFFFWQNGRLQNDGSDLEVPFVAVAETSEEQNGEIAQRNVVVARPAENAFPAERKQESLSSNTARQRPGLQSSPPADFLDPVKGSGTPSWKGKEKSRKKYESEERAPHLYALTVALALLLIVAIGAAAYFALPTLRSHFQNVTEYASKAGVGLQVARLPDGQLDLTWNRRAAELENAKSAKLTIIDGALFREVNMDNAQLRSGKLTYFPNSADVQFRLEVNLDNARSLAEWVRVLSPGVNTSGTDSRVATDSSNQNEVPPPANPAPVAAPSIEVPVHREFKAPVLKPLKPIALRTSQPQNGFREWAPPPDIRLQIEQNSAPLPLPLLLAPLLPIPAQFTPKISGPGVNDNPPRTEYAPKNANLVRSSTGSQPVAGINLKPTDTTQADRTASVRTWPPKSVVAPVSRSTPDPSAASIYIPPRPIQKSVPNTRFLGASINDDVLQVEVQVRIDASGHVTEAHALQNGKKISSLLTGAAVAAAKRWTFEPAIFRGRPVSADHTIVFEFRGRP